MQLTSGFVVLRDLAAQFVESADQLTGGVVLVKAVDRDVGEFHQQFRLNAGVVVHTAPGVDIVKTIS